jgi:dipeptidyl-peptidase-4
MRRITLALLLVLVAFAGHAQKRYYESLREALSATRTLRGDAGPADLEWIGAGDRYSYTKKERGNQQIWISDIRNHTEELVFSETEHTFPDSHEPFTYKDFAWTRDHRYLLLKTNFEKIWRYSGNADYYYYSLEDEAMRLIVKGAFTAEVSPDGKKVGYGKDGNLFVFDLASGAHTQLTFDGAEKFYNGRFGWANEEEFGLVQAWKWSNDSRYIAYWQTDEREVPVYKLTDFSGQHPDYMEIPYPEVGDPTPVEKIGIIDLQDGTSNWLDFDPRGGYMPRLYWTARPGTLALVWMNREQNHLKVYMFNVQDGSKKLVLEERSDTWLDIFDFFAHEPDLLYFPEEMETFFWISDRDGYSHIYHYDYEGKLLGRITEGPYDVVAIKAIDPGKKTLCYLSCEVSPLERNLFRVKFNGKGKERITHAAGNHQVDVSPRGDYFIDTYSDIHTPTSVDLCDGKGKLIRNLTMNQGVMEYLETHHYSERELFSFTTSDGQRIDGYLVKPMDFDTANSYPLLLSVYGGPGSQGVYNSFETSGWIQYLSQQGYVVANINNRGNGGYGSKFEKVVYRQLGKWETNDFAEAARYLAGEPWIDGERIGIMGHSFGGFSAGMSLLLHPDVFRAGIVTAAVSNHLNYDCIMSERYMGLIGDDEEGYRNSSMSALAGNLQGKMLLVHSLLDDNVHPQNTFQLVRAMIDHGKNIDLKIYPPGAHGVSYDNNSRIFLQEEYLNWLDRNLKLEK